MKKTVILFLVFILFACVNVYAQNDTNSIDSEYLETVIKSGNPGLVDSLIEKGVIKLVYATRYGDLELVKRLVENGIDINERGFWGYPIMCVNTLEMAKYLVEHGAILDIPNVSIIVNVMRYSRETYEIVKYLIEKGVDASYKNVYNQALSDALDTYSRVQNFDGDNFIASKNRAIDLIKLFLEHGADINSRWGSRLLLDIALSDNDLTFAKYLIEHGADVNARYNGNVNATTMLIANTHYITAAPKGYLMERYKLLVENGADVNASDELGRTPLMGAVRMQEIEHVRFFVEHGADINAKDVVGNTVFMYVCCADFYEIAEYLFGLGIDINAENNEGKTALMRSIENGDYDMMVFCLEHGAEIKQKYYIANPRKCTCGNCKDSSEGYLSFAGQLVKYNVLMLPDDFDMGDSHVCLCENEDMEGIEILPVEEGMKVKPITKFCDAGDADYDENYY